MRNVSDQTTTVKPFYYLLFLSSLLTGLYAVDIEATINPQTGTIGERFIYRVWIKADDTISVIFPQLKTDDEYIEIINQQDLMSVDPSRAGVEFQLRFWNVGEFVIPSYTCLFSGDGSINEEVTAVPVKITIQSIIDEKSPSLRDLISPVPLPPLVTKRENESGEVKLLEEGRDTDTVTVYMVNPPEETVTVRIFDESGQLRAKPEEVTFESENWQKSRSVYIFAVNEWKEEGDHSGRISFVMLSVDESEGREIDSAKYRIKDRGPFPYWLAARIFVVVLLVGFLIWTWLKKTGRLPSRVEVPPKTPPLQIALEKLGELDTDDVSTENIRTFYFELSRIIREFLEHEYFIRVLEMTTEEIREVLPQFEGEEEWENNLLELLERSDRVKFAKDKPELHKLQSDLEDGETVVRQAHREWSIFPEVEATEEEVRI